MTSPPPVTPEMLQQSFREEAKEILSELECALLELHKSGGSPELVSGIFRGLHTLKGSGSMFGFDRLAAFTHDLESAFDKVRNGVLPASPELIDGTLSALDQIAAMLDGDGSSADASVCSGILANLQQLPSAGLAPAGEKKQASAGPDRSDGPLRSWRIRFAPGAELMRCGANPLLLLRELCALGTARTGARLDALPSLREIDPERCYVFWEVGIETAAGAEAIRDVFLFVEDVCDLTIEPDAPASVPRGAAAQGLMDQRAARVGRRATDRPDSTSTLRIPAARLDQLVGLVGELVTVQARLSELSSRRGDPEIAQTAEEIERLSSALRESSMNLRMMPIRGTFERFRRLVHDLTKDLDKPVDLVVEGAETELDKAVIDQLGDPLMHLIRNSMDHGIESAEARAAQGKPAAGTIRLAARHAGATMLIEVSDDGAGIDCKAVREKAVERGLTTADAELTEREIFALLFEPGFSTARTVTDLSGRGVGLDVVRRTVESLRGTIEIRSERGRGTTIALRLPLTLAILDGLLVEVGEGRYVLPLGVTLECVELERAQAERAAGHMAEVRGEMVPYIRLRDHFGVAGVRPKREQIMVIECDLGRCGLMVDRVLGNCQTVIRSLGKLYRDVQGVSGATVLGDGTVALILDPPRLVQEAMRATTRSRRADPAAAP